MSNCTPLQQEILNESYEDLRRVVYKVAHKFATRDRVPFEECLGVAHQAFVEACRDYNPGEFKRKKEGKPNKSKLITYVYFILYCRLQTYLKRNHKHRFHCEVQDYMVGVEDCCSNLFMTELRGTLGEDALVVVELITNSSSDMQVLLRGRGACSKRSVINCLKEHLDDLGWTKDRINDSFDEIRVLLK